MNNTTTIITTATKNTITDCNCQQNTSTTTVKRSCGILRIITLRQPIRYTPVTVIADNSTDVVKNGTDVTENCRYSWSTDNVCWTSWCSYEEYLRIAKNVSGDFYLRLLVSDIIKGIYIDGCEQRDTNICLYNSGERLFTQELCNDNTVDFYSGLDCALNLQEQLANSIICMLGIPCYYLVVSPDLETKDLTFKEFTLHNVTDIRYMKLMLQDGQLPSSNPQMQEFDFDWQNDWEVEMGRRAFANAFGDNAFPKQRDLVYVPMLKRMYEVNAAYDEKQEGLLWRSTTWKLGLVKYNEKGNVEQGAFEDIIDNWVVNTYDDVFTENEREEQRRETGAGQIDGPRYVPNNLYSTVLTDPLRATSTEIGAEVTPMRQVTCNGMVIARNVYRFEDPQGYITYKPQYCGENGTIIVAMSVDDMQGDMIASFGRIELKRSGALSLSFKDAEYGDTFGSVSVSDTKDKLVIVCYRWNRANYVLVADAYTVPLRGTPRSTYTAVSGFPKTMEYNDAFINDCGHVVKLFPGKVGISSFKLYDTYLDDDTLKREMLKYTTTDEHCVICDSARPFEGGKGFTVR